MIEFFKLWRARRRHAAEWAEWHMSIKSAVPPRWWHRHLMHHEIFHSYMRQGKCLQNNGSTLWERL